MKTLAVIVLNWNGLEDTRALLRTLAHAHAPQGWRVRVMVVDNGSKDGSAETLAREFPDVEIVALPENRRFAGGNNEGLRRALAAGADAAMLLNNDTEADPQLLERLILALEQDAGAGAAAPLIFYAKPLQRIWYAGGTCHTALGLASHRGIRADYTGQYRAVEETGYLTGCCLVATREAWEKVGLLDERYFIYAEDSDWSLRARAAGYRLLFVPTARLWHKVSSSSGAASPFKAYHVVRANLMLFHRHARGMGRLTWLPSYLGQLVVGMAWLAVRGHVGAAAAVPRAVWDAMVGRDPAGVRL